MKVYIPKVAEWMLSASVVGILVIGGFMVYRALQPPPIVFVGIDVVNSPRAGELLMVEAEVKREAETGCTNGVQVDAMDRAGVMTRYPIPTRTISGGSSRYAIVVPETTLPGSYRLKIRETIYCGGGPKISETPWVAFEVVG